MSAADTIAQLAQLLADKPEWVTIFATAAIAGVRRWRVRPHQVEIRANEVHISFDGGDVVVRADQYEKAVAA